MDDMHDAPDAHGPATETQAAGRRIAWFPIAVLLAGCVALVYLYFAPHLSRDYRISFAAIAVGATAALGFAWFVVFSRFDWTVRQNTALVIIALVGGFFLLFEVESPTGDMIPTGIRPRWAKAPDQLLDRPQTNAAESKVDLSQTSEQDFPQFLGPNRNGRLAGPSLATDWERNPPELIWKQPIGAGSSGFAVVGDFAVTMEQRGERQLVICYGLTSGRVHWVHEQPGRFSTEMGGVGPLATPTIAGGRVYAQFPAGLLVCLAGSDGSLLWSHDVQAETSARPLGWGRAGSPLVVDGMAIVSAGGPNDESLVAYDADSGKLRWAAGEDHPSYASPALATLDGVEQVVSVNEDWIAGHRLTDGKLLWRHPWPGNSDSNATASQPVPIGPNELFVSKGYNIGCAVLKVERSAEGEWSATPRWEDPRLMRTKMTNVVVRGDYVYGLSAGILECVSLATGKRQWKRGRYGHGQTLLVGDLLLVVSESGEVALVDAVPEEYRELASFAAIDGKTWNNPALAGRYLLVRNAEEAACYKLPVKSAAQPPTD